MVIKQTQNNRQNPEIGNILCNRFRECAPENFLQLNQLSFTFPTPSRVLFYSSFLLPSNYVHLHATFPRIATTQDSRTCKTNPHMLTPTLPLTLTSQLDFAYIGSHRFCITIPFSTWSILPTSQHLYENFIDQVIFAKHLPNTEQGTNINMRKKNLNLTQNHALSCANVNISIQSTISLLNKILFLCFHIFHIIAIHILFYFRFIFLLKHNI